MSVYNNILEAIGHTPMVRLSKMTGPDDAEVLVKFEASESGGSIKTSHGYNMTPPRSSDGLMARTV